MKAKKVITKDLNGKDNGYLIELGKDGRRTTSYLTVAYPDCFKGYHLHRIRESNYICIGGKCDVITIGRNLKCNILTLEECDTYHIPLNVFVGLHNPYKENAYLINIPNPGYDPKLGWEQIDCNEDEIKEYYANNPE